MEELRTIARPYATAVFDIANKSETLSDWSIFLKTASKLLEQKEIITLIKTPGIEKSLVAEVFLELSMDEATSEENAKLFSNLMNVLSENKRLNAIKMISSQFEEKKQEAEETAEVKLISASDLPKESIDAIKQALTKKLGKKVELNISTDKTLIGGAVIKIGDHMIDGSVKSQLKNMNRFLIN